MLGVLKWIAGRWMALARKWRVAIVAGFSLIVMVTSAVGYRQWHYMQHDNRFCTSCHLMQDPYERFTRSAHSRLECHNCHKGRVPEQMHQLFLTLVSRPTAVKDHAEVPNEVCGACHIRGDSTRWKVIANTAGHRKHLESTNPRLRGIQCTTCHGVSVHEFASVDRTCGQSGCHADKLVRLGRMGNVAELHCTTCHNYLADARTVAFDSLSQPLTPAARQCVACHAMQERLQNLDIGLEPHRGVCGDCHNPHTQTSAQQVTCTNASCHSNWRSVSFHIGVPHPERCTACHQPHSWRVEGNNCTRCHARDVARVASAQRAQAVLARSAGAVPGPMPSPVLRTLPSFSHSLHRGQTCASCHSSSLRHGQLMVRSAADCQRCHHAAAGRDQCATCHVQSSLGQSLNSRPRMLRLSINSATESRSIAFNHARHSGVACVQCHSNPVSRAPEEGVCATCHDSHHRAASTCTTCHAGANALAKHTAASHTACASCHGEKAARLTPTREFCLVCHSAQVRHQPGKVCETCHHVVTPGTR
ncbi:MAG: hypothetical protein ACHQBP_06615 [Acidimicrobiales bacterium]